MRFLLASVVAGLMSSVAFGVLETGKVPTPTIKLSGDLGGKVSGEAWSSDEIKGKVWVLFYVDPDKKDLNEHVADALKAQNFPEEKFGSMAVINMAATITPNFLLNSSLKKKQEKFPRTVYVKDMNRALVNNWGFTDDSYCIALFDKDGTLLFQKDGKFTEAESTAFVDKVKTALASENAPKTLETH